ncbi:MAG: response regulator, partial [Eubacteriales bacterium]|nr:response regulator [Eubacteriales bacterium]
MTFKVFLVDDEIAIREGIRNAPLWEKGDFTLVGEAGDGEMALPMIQDEQPDILVTDIRMPFMDGMQLAEEISRQMPWVEMIILSGYDDFAYARKAMSLGVQEYLLKPISSADLREALEKAALRIRAEKQRRESMEQLRRRMAYGNRFLKEKLLMSVLTESADTQTAQKLLEQLHTMGIHLAAKRYQVADLFFEEPASSMEAGQEIVYELAERSAGAVLACASHHGSLALVLGDSDADVEERV